MSDYVQFRVAHQTAKIDGKEYKAGDLFAFEAGNEAHRRMWRQGVIVEENVTPKAKSSSKSKRGSGKK